MIKLHTDSIITNAKETECDYRDIAVIAKKSISENRVIIRPVSTGQTYTSLVYCLRPWDIKLSNELSDIDNALRDMKLQRMSKLETDKNTKDKGFVINGHLVYDTAMFKLTSTDSIFTTNIIIKSEELLKIEEYIIKSSRNGNKCTGSMTVLETLLGSYISEIVDISIANSKYLASMIEQLLNEAYDETVRICRSTSIDNLYKISVLCEEYRKRYTRKSGQIESIAKPIEVTDRNFIKNVGRALTDTQYTELVKCNLNELCKDTKDAKLHVNGYDNRVYISKSYENPTKNRYIVINDAKMAHSAYNDVYFSREDLHNALIKMTSIAVKYREITGTMDTKHKASIEDDIEIYDNTQMGSTVKQYIFEIPKENEVIARNICEALLSEYFHNNNYYIRITRGQIESILNR